MSNKVLLVLTTILILIIAAGTWLLISPKNKPPSAPPALPQIGQEPKLLSVAGTKIKRELTKTAKITGDLILADNPEFKITYLIYNDQFIVNVKAKPFATSKAQAEKWFADKGFGTGDLCLLKITFAASKEIKPDFASQDAVPSGCPTVTP